ncbi:MAG: RNA polymerase sigma factor, partial [Planctomycetota bacterium]|nr:RNA polymerase sigma factor [Planctomycetota bacterium]
MRTTELLIEALKLYRQEHAEKYIEEFWRLTERHRADLYNRALALLGNPEDAEDVVQETLRVTFAKLHKLQDPDSLGRWMRRVNRNIALYVLRKRRAERKATKRLAEVKAGEAEGGGDRPIPDGWDIRDAVIRSVDALPDTLRAVVTLRYVEDLSYEEIAGRLGVSLATVKIRMFRAHELLQKRLRTVSYTHL